MLHSRFRVSGRTIASSRIYNLLTNKKHNVFFPLPQALRNTSKDFSRTRTGLPLFPLFLHFFSILHSSFDTIPSCLHIVLWLFLSVLQENRGLGSKMTDSKYFTTTKKGLLSTVLCFSVKILMFYKLYTFSDTFSFWTFDHHALE